MADTEMILLDHGSGGTLTHRLLDEVFRTHFDNPILQTLTDSAVLEGIPPGRLAFTTDSYVVNPIMFPGGNIGKLAVCGTVNDLAVSGAQPVYLSAGFILEEGLPWKTLEQIVQSMAAEARQSRVTIVTGDTKVVEKGACDQIFINTAGIGILQEQFRHISYGTEIQTGDLILVNGYIADHGMAVLGKRHELDFETEIVSDCASLNGLIARVLALPSSSSDGSPVRFMRDATRGGIATVLCELVQHKERGILLDESALPVRESVKGLCEVLGFDPLYVANEGKVVFVVARTEAEAVLHELRQDPLGQNSAIIGEVVSAHPGTVVMNTEVGGKRLIEMLSGAQLPRIC
jgi:hydrogenase expression/formation protein HypE